MKNILKSTVLSIVMIGCAQAYSSQNPCPFNNKTAAPVRSGDCLLERTDQVKQGLYNMEKNETKDQQTYGLSLADIIKETYRADYLFWHYVNGTKGHEPNFDKWYQELDPLSTADIGYHIAAFAITAVLVVHSKNN